MPRYFFHRTDGHVDHDTDGVELADESDARIHAIIFAGETIRDEPERVWNGQEFHVAVTNAKQKLLFSVRIECVIAATREDEV